jgi:hypothetical protein
MWERKGTSYAVEASVTAAGIHRETPFSRPRPVFDLGYLAGESTTTNTNWPYRVWIKTTFYSTWVATCESRAI